MARSRAALLGALFVASAALECGGIEGLPHEVAPRSLPGIEPAFECTGKDGASERTIPFEVGWRGEGALESIAPLRDALRASDVKVDWSKRQLPANVRREPAKNPAIASLVPLGGGYWTDTPYRIVPTGQTWVSTGYAHTESGLALRVDGPQTGWAWTSFKPSPKERFLRLSVGGGAGVEVGVELLARAGEVRAELPECRPSSLSGAFEASVAPATGLEGWVRVLTLHGDGHEPVVGYPISLESCGLTEHELAVRIFDRSPTEHVNVGPIELSEQPLGDDGPVWGFADYHTHPTDNLAFGGLQGIHTVWGAPGGDVASYLQPDAAANTRELSRDIPPCDEPHKRYNAHHGGFGAPIMLAVAEGQVEANIDDLTNPNLAELHPNQGGPTFRDYPDFRRGSHEQYHISQIYRAYLGGLRLMTALAVQNAGLEFGMGWALCGDDGNPYVQTTKDWDIVRAHVEVIRELAKKNQSWMAIAYTPEEARSIIRSNRLAVVLGAEVGRLGEPDDGSLRAQADRLVDLGIRQVLLVHGMDNGLAGSAVFVDLYNSVSDWLNRPSNVTFKVEPLSGVTAMTPFEPASFFQITTDPSPLDPNDSLLFRLSDPPRAVLSDLFARPSGWTYNVPIAGIPYGALHPFVSAPSLLKAERSVYDGYGPGQRNVRGLQNGGREFLVELVQRGVVIDFAHMSDQTVKDAQELLNRHHCAGYPYMVSHTHFRHLEYRNDYSDHTSLLVKNTSNLMKGNVDLSACVQNDHACNPTVLREARKARELAPDLGPGSTSRGNLPTEFTIATTEVHDVDRRGGVLGVFVGQAPLDQTQLASNLPFANDCAESSKSFATALWFAQQEVTHSGTFGLATDFTQIRNVSPRFGAHACSGYLDGGTGSSSAVQLLEAFLNPAQYRFDAQTAAVRYTLPSMCSGLPCAPNPPLAPYVMGERTYNFNVDGLAHFGLLPDLLQDVANVVTPKEAGAVMAPLFNAAEGYIEMWEKQRAEVGCDDGADCGGREPRVNSLPTACGDACPDGWNRGAPLQSLDDRLGECEAGADIHLIRSDMFDHFTDVKPIYSQRGTDPNNQNVCLNRQGDWAIFPALTRQLWRCGDQHIIRTTDCPTGTNYIEVRRILEATVGDVQNCNWLPMPPERGNRSVVFECLSGPPYTGSDSPYGGAPCTR